MKDLKRKQKKQFSSKKGQEDPARNDNFEEEKNRPSVKEKEHKLVRGRFVGKKWFPE